MSGKRKRPRKKHHAEEPPEKRVKLSPGQNPGDPVSVQHPLLCLYYPRVLTLYDYILSRLPPSSRSRRRKVSARRHQGQNASDLASDTLIKPSASDHSIFLGSRLSKDDEHSLAKLLGTTLVGLFDQAPTETNESRSQDFISFSQQVKSSAGSSLGNGSSTQSEVIDFAIWRLFNRTYRSQHRPPHLLCHGYQKATLPKAPAQDHSAAAGIPGIISHFPNSHVTTIKGNIWNDLLRLMGKEGDQIMLDLVSDCGIFLAIENGYDNYYQLSGIPLPDLPTLQQSAFRPPLKISKGEAMPNGPAIQNAPIGARQPSSITFVRNRMMHARAALNAKGEVRFGLRHIHVLNRYPCSEKLGHTVHFLKYLFPRQFGLHNVFTSSVDSRETVQPFKDYTLREQEITQFQQPKSRGVSRQISKRVDSNRLPRRLRGALLDLARKFQRLHSRCSYNELLKHYCPVDYIDGLGRSKALKSRSLPKRRTQHPSTSLTVSQQKVFAGSLPQRSLVDAATPIDQVSAFCRAALSNIIPHEMWGVDEDGEHNLRTLMYHFHCFVHLRRFEGLTLHNVYQGFKISSISWLIPPQVHSCKRASKSDMQKRKELFLEFLYYCFDSMLIPLIRSNFHVTESNVHRNRLFFFRHDVWRALTEPSLVHIKLSMFEELTTEKARKLLDARSMGFSQIRLLPKGPSVRPIMNLRRRVTKLQSGKMVLGLSINSLLAPVFNMLSYEKIKQSERFGSALFSVGDVYAKLKAFQTQFQPGSVLNQTYYFAKVDVQSCFDTIPQRKVVRLIEGLVSETQYRVARHTELKPGGSHGYQGQRDSVSKPTRKFIARARARNDFASFEDTVNQELSAGKKGTIFVDAVMQTFQGKEKLLDLLGEHVERNIVKIGKKFFRQKKGIPQGSVLSSLLCNFFYAEFETQHLAFLNQNSQLFRLIDDFLLITTDRQQAQKFVQVMHAGNGEYGISVNPRKSLTNFNIKVNSVQIPRLAGSDFPYCGITINPKTLEITKDRDRRRDTAMVDSLTVDISKTPGQNFYRKAMNSIKIQTYAMLLDTSFNSQNTVLSTIYENFTESAMKCYRYAKSMGSRKQPAASILIRIIRDLINLGFVLIKSKQQKEASLGYMCSVSKGQMEWLASMAFRNVLGIKQSSYGQVVAWLDERIASCQPGDAGEADRLRRIVQKGNRVFGGYRF